MTMQQKRSGTAGKVPLVADLLDGEIALNITDAVAFMKKTVGGVPSVVKIGAEMATPADFRAGAENRSLHADKVWAAAAFVTLTYAATITMNLSAAINATVTLTGATAQLDFSNAKPGQSGAVEIVQDATGGRLLTYAAKCNWGKAGPPTLNTAAGKIDTIFYFVRSASDVRLSFWEGA